MTWGVFDLEVEVEFLNGSERENREGCTLGEMHDVDEPRMYFQMPDTLRSRGLLTIERDPF